MKILKIFLASSSELANDRKEFELFIGRENKTLAKKNLFLELITWEDFINSMSRTRLQQEYNNAIKSCDIFLLLFFSKVGKYTKEEFETAFGNFKSHNKPLIFTYFKNSEIKIGNLKKNDILSLWAFQDRLSELGHFQTVYENTDDLKNQFKRQLDKVLDDFVEGNISEVGQVLETLNGINEQNEKVILELMDYEVPKTKEFLVDESGFNKRKINRIINRLIKKDLVNRAPKNSLYQWVKTEPK